MSGSILTVRNISRYFLSLLMMLAIVAFCVQEARAQMGFGDVETVTAKAYSDKDALTAGSSGNLAVQINVSAKYHIQSAKPLDDSLIATELKLTPVPGITFGAPRYPNHELIALPALSDTGKLAVYQGTVTILVPYTIAANAPAGDVSLQLKLTTQACDDQSCQPPNTAKMKIDTRITAAGAPAKAINEKLFTDASAQKFLPTAEPTAPTTTPAATTASATLAATPAVASAEGAGTVVTLMSEDEQVAKIKATDYHPGNGEESNLALGWVLVFALVGGMILNVMPCVLPVIPLKVLGLIQQAHGDRRQAMLHGIVFSLGIITLFLALAVVLKTAGLFYGQQFQSTAFLIIMAMFVLTLALSMLNVFTISPPQAVYSMDGKHSGFAGSYMNGLLATLLATPCSAPYLGGVLAWALVQPTAVTLMALGVVGVGMSLPYLVLAMFPAALEKIPRAGRWSELLKQGFGIVMIGVAIYLITRISNVTLWPWLFFGALLLSLVVWAWGQIPTYSMSSGAIWGIRSVAVAVGIACAFGLQHFAMASTVTSAKVDSSGRTFFLPNETNGEFMPFNLALVDEAIKQHRPVLVDWTASWCINCKFVEARVLENAEMQKIFKDKRAVLLRADLTNDNPSATALLNKLQSQSIPALAIFTPGAPTAPVVLRDLYSKEAVTKGLDRL